MVKMTGKKIAMIGLFLLLILAGCSQEPPKEGTQPQQQGSTNTTQPTSPPSQEKQTAEMNEQAVVTLTSSAIKAYWHVMTGGEPAADGTPVQSFLVNGMDYRYLGTDLDTMDKLKGYLEPFFTKESIDDFIKQAKIIEHEGRTAQPNADGGSILQWDKATAELAKDADGQKQYEMKVPLGDGANVQYEPVMVEVKQVKGMGWRISTPPYELK
ncbi:MAG: DL-endopeptidase inhibitor IseA family protein [Clostridia bacterium]